MSNSLLHVLIYNINIYIFFRYDLLTHQRAEPAFAFSRTIEIPICCGNQINLNPFGLNMVPVTFPTDDAPTEFRVDYCELFGKPEYFIFVLDPNISEDSIAKEFAKLEAENGVKRDWFHFVQWEKSYKIGSGGEPDINPKRAS